MSSVASPKAAASPFLSLSAHPERTARRDTRNRGRYFIFSSAGVGFGVVTQVIGYLCSFSRKSVKQNEMTIL